jgi:short-subunit dehydrogenase involved in D-alanine esterification of teichoic acids
MALELLVNYPDIRIIINNAALQLPMRLDDAALVTGMLVDEIAINLLAPTIIARTFMPQFMALSEPSAIVNISSGLAFF